MPPPRPSLPILMDDDEVMEMYNERHVNNTSSLMRTAPRTPTPRKTRKRSAN